MIWAGITQGKVFNLKYETSVKIPVRNVFNIVIGVSNSPCTSVSIFVGVQRLRAFLPRLKLLRIPSVHANIPIRSLPDTLEEQCKVELIVGEKLIP